MAEKKIGNRLFKVEPLLAVQALRLQARLLKVLGPAFDRLPEVLAAAQSNKDPRSGDLAFISILNDIVQKSTADDVAFLVKDVVELAMVQGASGSYNQVDMDGDFTGQLGDLMPVMGFVLAETFGDFFRGLAANGNRPQARVS